LLKKPRPCFRSFNRDWTLADRKVIAEDAILVLDPDTGDVVSSTGKDMFYMPHGLTVDGEGNIYVTDAGLHQVMRVSA
jgi:peptidylamidoglycolate lyase